MSADDQAQRLTRIHPPPAGAETIDARTAYAELDFGELAPEDRPYVIVNMVASVDGQARLGGDTSDLGDAADAALFATLRERVDCVMAGVRTIGIEHYRAMARSVDVRERREAAGLAPRPIFATVTRSGKLPIDTPLFADADLQVRVFSAGELDLTGVAASVKQVGETDPASVLRELHERDGVRSVLLEGGPHLNTPFFAAGLVDELFLTLAPTLIGGAELFPIIAGALPAPRRLELLGALSGDQHLFLRYKVA